MSIIEKVSEKEGGSYAPTFSEILPQKIQIQTQFPANVLGAGLLR